MSRIRLAHMEDGCSARQTSTDETAEQDRGVEVHDIDGACDAARRQHASREPDRQVSQQLRAVERSCPESTGVEKDGGETLGAQYIGKCAVGGHGDLDVDTSTAECAGQEHQRSVGAIPLGVAVSE